MAGPGQDDLIRRLPIVGLRAFWTPIVLSLGVLVIALAVWATGDAVLALAVTAALIRAVMVIGLYIFIGNSGVLAFGHATFMMVGAYGVAWLTLRPFNKSFALQLPEFLAAHQYPMLPSAIAAALLAAIVAFCRRYPDHAALGHRRSHRDACRARHVQDLLFKLERMDAGRGDHAGHPDLCGHVDRARLGGGGALRRLHLPALPLRARAPRLARGSVRGPRGGHQHPASAAYRLCAERLLHGHRRGSGGALSRHHRGQKFLAHHHLHPARHAHRGRPAEPERRHRGRRGDLDPDRDF